MYANHTRKRWGSWWVIHSHMYGCRQQVPTTCTAVVGSCDGSPTLCQRGYSLEGEAREQSKHTVTSIKQSRSIPEILQDSQDMKSLCQHPQKVDASPTIQKFKNSPT